jgi:hypothetical protein
VGVDHAGDDEVAAGVDGFFRGVVSSYRGGSDGDDAGIADDHGAIGNDLARRVHGDDVRVRDDEIGGLERGGRGHGLSEGNGRREESEENDSEAHEWLISGKVA